MYTNVLRKVFVLLVTLTIFGCFTGDGGEESDEEIITSTSIPQEAAELGNFPEEAEVAQMDELKVNGQDIDDAQSVQLEDTQDPSVDVSVTLPSSLSRQRGTATSLQLWLNGSLTDVAFDPATRTATVTVPLNVGLNYFCFVILSDTSKKYRSIVIKIKRLTSTDGVNPEITTIINLNYTTSDSKPISAIGQVSISVSSPDFDTISSTATGVSSATVTTPLASSVTVQVVAYTAAGDDTGAYSFFGAATTEITEQSHTVNVTMSLLSSKVIIPDYGNNRMVMIDSMNDTDFSSWQEISSFPAVDADVDSAGRIYAAAYHPSSNNNGLYCIEGFSDNVIPEDRINTTNNIIAVAVDKTLDFVYFIDNDDGTNLRKYSVSNKTSSIITGLTSISESQFSGVTGLEASGNGIVYITGYAAFIGKYDVSSGSIGLPLATYTGLSSDTKKTILFHNGMLYISQSGPANLVQLNASMELQGTSSATLVGPQNFIGRFSDCFAFIDEDGNGLIDTIKSMSTIADVAPASLGTTGSGIGKFIFFTGY